MRSFENLIVWEKSVELVSRIYTITSLFPKSETYALVDQLHRAVISIPSNIAEGCQRQTDREFVQFLYIAYGSCAEVRTQLIVAEKLRYIDLKKRDETAFFVKEIEKMLNVLIRKVQN